MDLIQEYREVEAKSREKYRGRMERQYKIVKPDATQEEIRYAMDTDQGSQVFSQAVSFPCELMKTPSGSYEFP